MRNMDDLPRLLGVLHAKGFDKPLKITVKDLDRSSEQNKLLHKLLSQISAQVTWHGQSLSVDVWKRLCTAAWLRESGCSPMLVPALDGHGIDMIFEHTSRLSVSQCASLITWVESFGSQEGVRWSAHDSWRGRY